VKATILLHVVTKDRNQIGPIWYTIL